MSLFKSYLFITREKLWENSIRTISDIQDYIEFIIKKHKTLTTIPPIHVYINRINNRLVFKIKDGYQIEIQMPEKWNLVAQRK